MSIPALGGGGSQALQRALMDAAERAVADELALLGGEDPAVGAGTAAGTGASAARTQTQVRRRAAATSTEADAPLLDEAIVVELGDVRKPGRLEVAGGWITTARRGPVETREAPEKARPQRLAGADIKGSPEARVAGSEEEPSTPAAARAASPTPVRPQPEPNVESEPEPIDEHVTLERLVVVLKKTGIDFRDAYQVLREIRAGAPLPPRAELRALWQAADPAAWEERARVRAAAPSPAQPTGRQETPTRPTADTDLGRTPVDDVIRDRTWHRDADRSSSTTTTSTTTTSAPRTGTTGTAPTLQTIAQHTPANQAYVAELSTAEFQRLVTIMGASAPEWFWDLRGHRGLRGLAERPAIARLNATRIAGTRLGAWLLAIVGLALLWYVGLHTGTWW